MRGRFMKKILSFSPWIISKWEFYANFPAIDVKVFPLPKNANIFSYPLLVISPFPLTQLLSINK
jgi:hypothetical protein